MNGGIVSFDTLGKVVFAYALYRVGKFCWRIADENQELKAELRRNKAAKEQA